MAELLPGLELRAAPRRLRAAARGRRELRRQRADQGPRRARRAPRRARCSPTTPGSRPRTSAARPGIYSARYAGVGVGDEVNLDKLLREVDAAGGKRRAAYVCALALVEPDGAEHVFEARCEGRLLRERRGSGGFGYDPIFVPDDLPPGTSGRWPSSARAEKNAISHRGRAARMLAAHLGLTSAAGGR